MNYKTFAIYCLFNALFSQIIFAPSESLLHDKNQQIIDCITNLIKGLNSGTITAKKTCGLNTWVTIIQHVDPEQQRSEQLCFKTSDKNLMTEIQHITTNALKDNSGYEKIQDIITGKKTGKLICNPNPAFHNASISIEEHDDTACCLWPKITP